MSRHVFGPKLDVLLDVLLVVAFILVCVGIDACFHQVRNGDWKCAFVKCVRVKT